MGSKFVIADPGLCIGCQTCMAGCMLKHSVPGDVAKPRLNLITTLTISAPIVCHHCADAPCVASCPEGALYFDGDRVAVKQERCIGCRSCVLACPYGAVEVISQESAARLGNLALESAPKASIVKCDLCVDRPGGPACVEACPYRALDFGDVEELRAKYGAEAVSSIPALGEDPTGSHTLIKARAAALEDEGTPVTL